ncbi:hypothetical protein [Sulfurospirillum cavolei]|uniref:hypothetical protein n=1 Tax=Sulfurospirillum cavolei TaxID=366522 RepID=UPI000764C66E|nr:hypothetical protein [Sulfurospirillum cavolei]
MKANFDNMRIFTTGSMNALGEVLKDYVIDSDDIDDDVKRKITNAFNYAGQRVNVLNCLYDDNVKDDVNDLSDVIEVELLKHEKSEEDDDEL